VESEENAERRKYPRIEIGDLVAYTPFAAATSLGEGRDVSLGGIRFRVVGSHLITGELLRVSFTMGEQTVDAVGRVLRTRRLDENATEVALEFVRIDPWVARVMERAVEDDPHA
jgi:c-di-GMP-binding flagellar brake protein YcgR